MSEIELKFKQNNFLKKDPLIINRGYYPEIYDNNQYFGPVTAEYLITAPNNYNHSTQINEFAKKVMRKAYGYNPDFNGENFVNATDPLLPGKLYKCEFIPIIKEVSSQKCLSFLYYKKALLVGAQGLTLTCQLIEKHFPDDRYVLSLDEKEALWKSPEGLYMYPYLSIEKESAPDNYFLLRSFDDPIPPNHYLLGISEK